MGNIDTYVQQNATDTLSERPLSPVDELVLCYLVYYDFGGIVPTTKKAGSIALSEAAALYKEKQGERQRNVNAPFLQHIAASARFADARLSAYDELFREGRAQFAAIRVSFAEGTEYLAFRGVDTSLTGWKEAFRASYSPSPSQRLATAYLDRHLTEGGSGVIVGGHSKGGNMALYAACACGDTARRRISKIMLFDSPGLTPGLYSRKYYREIENRVERYVPPYSLIGRVFTKEAPDRIVASGVEGLLQHEPLYWQVEGCDFVTAAAPDEDGLRAARVLNEWVDGTTREERKYFTADLFRILRERREKNGDTEAMTAPRKETKKPGRAEVLRLFLRGYAGAAKPSRRAVRKLIRRILADKLLRKRNCGRKQDT